MCDSTACQTHSVAIDAPGCHCCAPNHDFGASRRGHADDHALSHSCVDTSGFSWTRRIVAPAVLFAAGLVIGHAAPGRFGPAFHLVAMLSAYMLCGLPVLKEAWDAVRDHNYFNEFTLMGLATLVAIALGDLSEAVGVMLFYSLGEAAQSKAAGNSRRSIQALIASKPETANLMADGAVEVVRPEQVAVGSSILVKPGEKVPLDGVVLSGEATLDMSSLTGESLPVRLGKREMVYSGSICLDGDLIVETTAAYANSMVGKILAMVENAVAMKSRTERFITVFARYYTPAVVAAATLVAVLPPLLFGLSWNAWLYRALVLLVISCPCALVLSVPLTFFAGIGTASRHGMLVKGGQVFDALAKARAVVFDKTGTLTEGRLSLGGIRSIDGADANETLRFAAMAESRSNHPFARAILEAAGGRQAFHQDVATKDAAGKGVAAETPEGRVVVGNAKLMADNGVMIEEHDSHDSHRGQVAHVAVNGVHKGVLLFQDRLKEDSASAMTALRKVAGVEKLYMLTGDRDAAAAAVAKELGLDGYRAGLLPDQKVEAFRELSPDGDAVFVGDGVNDAPALAAAGTGVAMGALGSAAAVEAADAVILDDSPGRLALLFAIARKTRKIAGQNIILVLAVKSGFMALGIAGVSGLWEAVFADVGVAILAVLNAMRVTRL